jgi:hypothetical protein
MGRVATSGTAAIRKEMLAFIAWQPMLINSYPAVPFYASQKFLDEREIT